MRPFKLSDEGKKWFIDYLSKHKFTDIIDTDTLSQFTHWDITANYKGISVCFELKNRDCYSWEYGDTEINKHKYQHLLSSPYEKVILVTFFKDKWCMINLKTTPPTREYSKVAIIAHNWNKGKGLKEFVNWDLKNIQLMEYNSE